MDDLGQHLCVRVKSKNVKIVYENAEKIRHSFGLRISERCEPKQDVSKPGFVFIPFEADPAAEGKLSLTELSKLQSYVDTLCSSDHDDGASCGGEDSSYDSDYEPEDCSQHQDVSRTVSDTLGAEFAEYVSGAGQLPHSPAYLARVEFALRLGYTERLVQTALQKLGPDPGQNELLEELIKLGAQSPRQQNVVSETAGEDTAESVTEQHHQVEDSVSMQLRPIVIDGSNVAMSHGNKEVFSCRGIKLCVDWFRARGHREITVFVPKFRKESTRLDNPVTGQEILTELEKERVLVFTPSRLIGGKRVVCYDDRYIIKVAAENEGIVVSNDNYRDLAHESPEFRRVIEERILMYSFVNDRFMPPDDPLGRSGPTLDNFLRIHRRADPPPPCPYAKKCTYGNKCKFSHPERGPLPHKSVTERLVEQAQKNLQARGIHSRDSSPGSHLKGSKSLSLPLSSSSLTADSDSPKAQQSSRKIPLSRTKSSVPGLSYSSESGHQIKSKSLSVENVTGQMCYKNLSQMATPPPGYSVWSHNVINPDQKIWPQQQQYSQGPVGSHIVTSKKLSDPESSSPDPSVNLHQKLQRQLTLNPLGDPRLQRIQQYNAGRQQQHQLHQPVVRHGSGGPTTPGWEQQLHQNVIRIASAPDSYRQWPPTPPPNATRHMHRLSSTSDPQLNLCVAPGEGRSFHPDTFEGAAWPPTTSAPPPVVWSPAPSIVSPLSHTSHLTEDVRRKLHYHLASIFPEEQVQTVMRMYPDETNPQKICAAILAMFPKH